MVFISWQALIDFDYTEIYFVFGGAVEKKKNCSRPAHILIAEHGIYTVAVAFTTPRVSSRKKNV